MADSNLIYLTGLWFKRTKAGKPMFSALADKDIHIPAGHNVFVFWDPEKIRSGDKGRVGHIASAPRSEGGRQQPAAQERAPAAEGQISPDGKWVWNGLQWVPNQATAPPPPPPAPAPAPSQPSPPAPGTDDDIPF